MKKSRTRCLYWPTIQIGNHCLLSDGHSGDLLLGGPVPGPGGSTAGSQPHSELGVGVTTVEMRKLRPGQLTVIVQVYPANKQQTGRCHGRVVSDIIKSIHLVFIQVPGTGLLKSLQSVVMRVPFVCLDGFRKGLVARNTKARLESWSSQRHPLTAETRSERGWRLSSIASGQLFSQSYLHNETSRKTPKWQHWERDW